MRKITIFKAMIVLGVIILSNINLSGQTTIAKWTFETSVPTTAGPFSPEVGSGSATGYHTATSTFSNPSGNGSSESFSSTAWTTVGDYYQFQVSTVGYKNINISWDQYSSATGPTAFKLQYSIDGTSFNDIVSYTVNNASTWASSGSPKTDCSFTNDLSSITTLNEKSAIYLRLALVTAVSASTGTDRVDNVLITDNSTITSLNQPSANSNISASNGKITFTASAHQTVEIYNAVGQKLVSKVTVEGLNTIPVSARGVVLVKVGNSISKVIL